MRKLILILNLSAAAPVLLVLPLAPFVFLLVDGDGLLPGMLHERLFQSLMILHPPIALACFFISMHWRKCEKYAGAVLVGALPLLVFGALALVFFQGGVQLR